jgi:hypothetical protein
MSTNSTSLLIYKQVFKVYFLQIRVVPNITVVGFLNEYLRMPTIIAYKNYPRILLIPHEFKHQAIAEPTFALPSKVGFCSAPCNIDELEGRLPNTKKISPVSQSASFWL